VALAAQSAEIDPQNDAELENLCGELKLDFVRNDRGLRLLSNGADISDLIRTPEITMLASAVSARPMVRHYLLDLQRKLADEKSAVFEGRDMGTVVFPEADVKFFLNASTRERAQRRFNEFKADSTQTLDEVERDIQQRDKNDSTRAVAPLKPAEDAIVIDSTNLTVAQVVEKMLSHIE
jgi:cytidylate kinase